jgi:hypothetical protein
MKRAVLITLLTVICGHVSARPAIAQAGVIRWLEKLSGPGPLEAYGYELYPLCYGKNTGRSRSGREPIKEPAEIDKQPFAPGFDLNCRGFSRDHVLVKFGFQIADFHGKNQLEYDPSVPASLTDSVKGKIYSANADVSLASGLFELGAGIGRLHFTGTPAGSLTHPLYEIRGNFNIIPIARWRQVQSRSLSVEERYRMDWLQFRLSINIVPGGLDDADFGAIPGSFGPTDTEISVYPSIVINFGNLFDW